jgi:hypothetical protein
MVLVAGLRDMIGGFDVYIYGDVYENITFQHLYSSFFEKGFTLYFYILSFIEPRREFMFFCTALLILSLHVIFIKKYSPYIYISLFIYFAKFYLMSFVYLRQGIAMGFIWFAFAFFYKKKYFKFSLLVVLAFYFHQSSLIILPFLFIANKRLNYLQILGLSVVILLLSFLSSTNIIISTFAENINSEKILAYTEKSSSINLLYLFEGISYLVILFFFKPYFYKNKITVFVFNGFLLYIFIILFSLRNATFIRFSWYFFIFVILGIPYIYLFLKREYNKSFLKLIVFTYYSLVFFRLLFVYDGGDFMPYKSIYQDFDRGGRWEYMEYR